MPFRSQFKSNEDYNKWFREYRARNSEKMRKYQREYNRKWRKEHGYHNETNSIKRYPEKQKARMLVRQAVKIGFLKKSTCSVCGNPNSQAHHKDYSKPLEVEWLCPLHHKDKHRKY